jgi:hypothetical protein
LTDTGRDPEDIGSPAIKQNAGLGPCKQQVHPPPSQGPDAKGSDTRKEPIPINPIVCLGEVKEDQASLLLGFIQVFNHLKVSKDVVCNRPLRKERRLSRTNNRIQRLSKAGGQRPGYNFIVSV